MKVPIVYIISAIIAIAIVGGIAYAIIASDLPDWLKFWLLR